MFATKFQAALLLVLVSISFSAALKCYNCQYVEGTTNSDCKSNLRDDFLVDVPPYPGVRSSPSTKETAKLGQMFNVTSSEGADDAKQDYVPLCEKIVGEVDGLEVIIRSGVYGPASYTGTCATESGEVTATACWCDTDGCNGDTDDGSGDGEDGSGDAPTVLNFTLSINVQGTVALFKPPA